MPDVFVAVLMVDSFVLILIVDSEIQFPPIQTSFGKQISKLINSVCDRDSVLFYLYVFM